MSTGNVIDAEGAMRQADALVRKYASGMNPTAAVLLPAVATLAAAIINSEALRRAADAVSSEVLDMGRNLFDAIKERP